MSKKTILLSAALAASMLIISNNHADARKVGNNRQQSVEVEAILFEVAVRYGIEPESFLRVAKIESGMNPNAYHPKSRASGVFQFIPSTARLYGLVDPFDVNANAEAAARLWQDNASRLTKALGREPTAGELYLAHQQGAAGSIALLTNAGKPAVEIVGTKAVLMNGGHARMTAGQFAKLWTARFN